MIDETFLKTLQEVNHLLQQNKEAIRAASSHYRLVESVGTPRVDPGVIRSLENWSRLNLNLVALPDTHEIRDFLACTRELSALYSQLAHAVSAVPNSLPPALFHQSVVEVLLHTRSIEALFPRRMELGVRETSETYAEEDRKQQTIRQIVEETRSEVEEWLHRVHPSLCVMWQGARQALVSDNPDRTRQVMVSLRTLLDHLTRVLAPDDEVRAWSSDPEYYQDQKMKTPKGKGRLFYICRHIHDGDDSFAKFLDADINAIVSLWISLNRLHKLEQTLSDIQLRVMVERFESALLLLIRASEVQDKSGE